MSVADDVHWNLDLDPGTGRTIRLAGGPSAAGIRLAAGGQEVTTYLTPFGAKSASVRIVVLKPYRQAPVTTLFDNVLVRQR